MTIPYSRIIETFFIKGLRFDISKVHGQSGYMLFFDDSPIPVYYEADMKMRAIGDGNPPELFIVNRSACKRLAEKISILVDGTKSKNPIHAEFSAKQLDKLK